MGSISFMIILILVGCVILFKTLYEYAQIQNSEPVTCKAVNSVAISENLTMTPKLFKKNKSVIVYSTIYETEIGNEHYTFTDPETTGFPIATGVTKDFYMDKKNKFYNKTILFKRIKGGLFFIVLGIVALLVLAL